MLVTATGNQQILLKEIPKGTLKETHFEMTQGEIPAIDDGQILVRTILLSLDAANRAWMQGATYRSAIHGGDVMAGGGIAQVIESKSDRFSPGDLVFCETGWQEYNVVKAKTAVKTPNHRPTSHLLSLLGIAGLTAHHGLIQVGAPKEGETIVVSAAAGSVGTLVGQIAKAIGCRAVGIAGGPEKCAWLKDELGFDDAVDYKSDGFFRDLKAACPDGIDVYFDNVGGPILEACLFQMNMKGHIVCCGAVSQYDTEDVYAPKGVPGLLVVKRLRMEGFIAMDFPDKDRQAQEELSKWVSEEKIKVIEDVIDGLENAPKGLIGLLNGENRGKRMIRVAPDPA